MQNELKSIVELLQRLNNGCNQKVIGDDEVIEILEELQDFSSIPDEIAKILKGVKDTEIENVDEIVENLIHLHLKLSDSIWHIEQIHELVKRMAGNYRESL
ncbi:hypothetical protein P4V54_13105 [Brevibacillus nitrificans]|uniref:hypothetical protein n=1 Tax=Brevibacillus nitrificans TaxID=651560 RepID=UPI002E21BB9A|nr:hypothetical protein [Brevibacillus nitrificans]